MKVLILTPWYPVSPAATHGLFIRQQVDALTEAGCEAVVISPRPHWLPIPGKRGLYWRENNNLPEHQVIDGVDAFFPRYLVLPRQIGWSGIGRSCLRAMGNLIQTLNRRHGFDIVHGHEFLPVGLFAAHLRQLVDIPLLLTVHGQNPALARFLGRARSNRIRQEMWRAIDQVIAVGTPLVEWLYELGCDPGRVNVVANGVDIRTATVDPPPDYQRRFGGLRVILSVSNLFPTKGVSLNLAALRRLLDGGYENYHCVIIGDGPDRGNLERRVGGLGLHRNVTFLGRVLHAETLAYMSACDVFSLPSWQEAFGIVYLEAMALGKPVIGCRGQGAEDIVIDQLNGLLVKPRDVDDLTLALSRILREPECAASVGVSARKRAADFSWQRNASRCKQLYVTAAAKSRIAPE